MPDENPSRREALGVLLRWGSGLGLLAVPGLLRCTSSKMSQEAIDEQARLYDTALDCTSTTGLFPVHVKTRTDNKYRDRSERSDRYCFNCSNYERAANPNVCGGCRTVKGPIHPLGLCEAWTELRS